MRDREDDVVWRVRAGDGWLYVYLLLEFQSTVDRHMAVRIMSYVGLMYQDLLRTGAVSRGKPLPRVVPVVLYNGQPRWDAATVLADLVVSIPGSLRWYCPQVRYLLVDEGATDESEPLSVRNLVAALFRLEKSRQPGDVRQMVPETGLVYWKKRMIINVIRSFIVLFVLFVFWWYWVLDDYGLVGENR